MSPVNAAVQNKDLEACLPKREWQAPELRKMAAGAAETGPGMAGETNSMS